MYTNTHEFKIQIDHQVNPPNFLTYINISNAIVNQSVYTIDVYANNSNVIYDNNTIIFHTPDSKNWTINEEYYITFDAGVLYSNNVSNSTAQTNQSFWKLFVVNNGSSSIGPTNTIETSGTITNSSTTTLRTVVIGEPPPTRSAKLGIGLGIAFIAVLFIGEIIYFKYCYHGIQRNSRDPR